MLAIAAHQLEAAPEDLQIIDGRIQDVGTPTAGTTIAEVAWTAYTNLAALPPGQEAGLEAEARYAPNNFITWTNESHGLEGTFRSFGENPMIADTVRERRELYIALSERIWSPTALGFGKETTPPTNRLPVPKKGSAPAPRLAAGAAKAAAGGKPTLAKMVRAGVVQVGQKVYTIHQGTEHQATMAPRGLIELYEGVRCTSPDTALNGMDLWLTQVDGQ
jgi:hypothetical protein